MKYFSATIYTQTSTLELFAKNPFTIFAESSILDVDMALNTLLVTVLLEKNFLPQNS